MYKKINFVAFKDPNSSILQKIVSIAASIAFFALLIVLLPSILIFLLSFFVLMAIISLIVRFFIAKETSNMKFAFKQQYQNDSQNRDKEEDHNMIDVTNSAQKEE